jgi:carbonic anhydrase
VTRSLIVVAVLVAGSSGCEQLKSPQRIHELEERVDKLSGEVATLKGGNAGSNAGAGSAEPGAGSGEPGAEPGSGSAEPGAGSAETAAAEPGAGSGEHGAGSGASVAAAGSGEPAAAAKTASGDGERGHGEAGRDEGSRGEAGRDEASREAGRGEAGRRGAGSAVATGDEKIDRAIANLRDVVAANTGPRSREPAAPAGPRSREPAPPPVPGALPHWDYEGKSGPPTWGTLDPAWRTCVVGKAQSPIDIEPRPGSAGPITFHYKPTVATPFDNGHTLEVDLAPGSTIEIDGTAYQLLQFHFHMPSEHTIAGEHYPLEVHLVHQDGDGKLAVIGVLYDSGAESRALGAVWSRWPKAPGGQDRTRKTFDPSDLLPETRTVYRYSGSLTTPPCSEGVLWNVMRRTMTDSKAHFDAFARHYPHNARPLQPRNDRKVE